MANCHQIKTLMLIHLLESKVCYQPSIVGKPRPGIDGQSRVLLRPRVKVNACPN